MNEAKKYNVIIFIIVHNKYCNYNNWYIKVEIVAIVMGSSSTLHRNFVHFWGFFPLSKGYGKKEKKREKKNLGQPPQSKAKLPPSMGGGVSFLEGSRYLHQVILTPRLIWLQILYDPKRNSCVAPIQFRAFMCVNKPLSLSLFLFSSLCLWHCFSFLIIHQH